MRSNVNLRPRPPSLTYPNRYRPHPGRLYADGLPIFIALVIVTLVGFIFLGSSRSKSR